MTVKRMLLGATLLAAAFWLGAPAALSNVDRASAERSADPSHELSDAGMCEAPEMTSDGQRFGKKSWKCICQLYADADGQHTGEWKGTVVGRTRIGVEKHGANKACEEATASRAVNCKNCSCAPEK